MYQNPKNMEELSKIIQDLEIKAASQKIDIEETASYFMESLKPVNLLKSALQPIIKGPIGKFADKLLLNYRKLVYKRAEPATQYLISNYNSKTKHDQIK
jgi:hypothetical protein